MRLGRNPLRGSNPLPSAVEEKIRDRISKAIENRVFPGCVVGIVWSDGSRMIIPAGNFTYDPKSRKMEACSVFDIASVTKSIPTSSLALKLLEEGKLRLEDRLSDFLPVSENPEMKTVTVEHLLTHTLDWGFRLSEMKEKPREEIISALFSAKFRSAPGTTFFYSNATSILLGLLVEKVCESSLDKLGADVFFSPLGMPKTTFHPLGILESEEIVPTEIQEWRGGLVQGEVHDESAHALKTPVGSAGLFSCVPDLLNFMEMLLNKGEFGGKRYFTEKTVENIQIDRGKSVGAHIGRGWELDQPWYMGTGGDGKRFGKTGFTGCSCVCDIGLGKALVILSNRVYPKRKKDSSDINEVRRDIADIVFNG